MPQKQRESFFVYDLANPDLIKFTHLFCGNPRKQTMNVIYCTGASAKSTDNKA